MFLWSLYLFDVVFYLNVEYIDLYYDKLSHINLGKAPTHGNNGTQTRLEAPQSQISPPYSPLRGVIFVAVGCMAQFRT
jgi:hypothetical protein